jgi:hypothetical protein
VNLMFYSYNCYVMVLLSLLAFCIAEPLIRNSATVPGEEFS